MPSTQHVLNKYWLLIKLVKRYNRRNKDLDQKSGFKITLWKVTSLRWYLGHPLFHSPSHEHYQVYKNNILLKIITYGGEAEILPTLNHREWEKQTLEWWEKQLYTLTAFSLPQASRVPWWEVAPEPPVPLVGRQSLWGDKHPHPQHGGSLCESYYSDLTPWGCKGMWGSTTRKMTVTKKVGKGLQKWAHESWQTEFLSANKE